MKEPVSESVPPIQSQVILEPLIHLKKPLLDSLIMVQESLSMKEFPPWRKKEVKNHPFLTKEPMLNVTSKVVMLNFKDPPVKNSELNAPRDVENSKEEWLLELKFIWMIHQFARLPFTPELSNLKKEEKLWL
jgi:hypothetical protein